MVTLIISIITACICVVVAVFVIFRRHGQVSNVAFSLGLVSTALVIMGDAISLLHPEDVFWWKKVVFIGEAVMAPSWLLFTLSFARSKHWRSISKFSQVLVMLSPLLLIFCLAVPTDSFFFTPGFEGKRSILLDNAGYTYNLILLFYSIMSIVNLEATLKSSAGGDRYKIKYTLIGVGGFLAINIFYYSHALLYRSIDMSLVPVKAGVILISIIFISYSLLQQKVMDVEVSVSRKVLYRSISIFVVGFYLLGLGLLGEGMRYFDPHVRENMVIFLGFAGVIVIITIIFSERLRRKAMVLIDKHFLSQKYDYREQWLQFTQRISLKHTFDELLSAIAHGFRDAIGSKGSAIWLKERAREQYSCVKALDSTVGKRGPGKVLLNFLNETEWILNVNDSKCESIVMESKKFIDDNSVFLMVPLIHREELVGFITLREAIAEVEYNYEDYDLLKTLASQASTAILNAKLSEELIEAKEMEAVGRLSAFVIHDLKNASSMLSLLAHNAEDHIDNPEFQKDAIRAIVNSSEKIKDITLKLKNLPRKKRLVRDYYDLGMFIKGEISQVNSNGSAQLSFKEREQVRVKFDRGELQKVIINLIMNAMDATGRKGTINVEVGKDNKMAFFKVSDNGCGMSGEFMDKHLFRPFQSSKNKGLGIGLYQCKVIIEEHEGKIKVKSRQKKGSEFTVYLPWKAL